jgi:hypothetical protein
MWEEVATLGVHPSPRHGNCLIYFYYPSSKASNKINSLISLFISLFFLVYSAASKDNLFYVFGGYTDDGNVLKDLFELNLGSF